MAFGVMPKRGGGSAVDDEGFGLTSKLLVGDDVCELGELLEAGHDLAGDLIKLGLAGIFDRVLILGAADPIVDGEVLNGLHVELDASYFLETWPETVDDCRG